MYVTLMSQRVETGTDTATVPVKKDLRVSFNSTANCILTSSESDEYSTEISPRLTSDYIINSTTSSTFVAHDQNFFRVGTVKMIFVFNLASNVTARFTVFTLKHKYIYVPIWTIITGYTHGGRTRKKI